MKPITIIGAGLAGCEAAWQIAKRGGEVILYEMKPEAYSPAHRSPFFAELVCSNSFKSESIENASGVLKEEMGQLESLVLKVAKEAKVPAGGSLAVDREVFSKQITQILESLENVVVIREEVSSIPQEGITIVATGPLTSEALSKEIQKVTGTRHLFFYDAISPIITADSINFQKAFKSSRYGKGGEDYVNCPMEEGEYYQFVETLNEAGRVPVQQFEKRYLFEGCLPVEEMRCPESRRFPKIIIVVFVVYQVRPRRNNRLFLRERRGRRKSCRNITALFFRKERARDEPLLDHVGQEVEGDRIELKAPAVIKRLLHNTG